jgi:signal transduction histidine kinase
MVAALLRLSSLPREDWDGGLQEVLKIDSQVLSVGRVGYWSFRPDPPHIFCELNYSAASGTYERGDLLFERDSARYFDEVRKLQVVDARDARRDPRTRGLSSYLEDRGIGAMLDTPVCYNGTPVGILCQEHVGPPRNWTSGDQEFALAVAQTLAAMLEARERARAAIAERHASFLSQGAMVLTGALTGSEVAKLAARLALPTLGEMAFIAVCEGGVVIEHATAYLSDGAQALAHELAMRFPRNLSSHHLLSTAIRKRESIVVPARSPEALATIIRDETRADVMAALRARSAMAIPFLCREPLQGGLLVLRSDRPYDQNDLRLAECYARQVGGFLENACLYQRAQEAISVRDEFLALASHELRTPLTSLHAAADAIVQEASKENISPEAMRRMGALMVRQVDRLDRLSQQILDASRLGVGRLQLRPAKMDLAALVREVARDFEARAQRAGSTLDVHAEGPVLGEWDARRLEQVVCNLIDNAVKFGAGRPIDITVRHRDAGAVLTVRDRGIGIASTPHEGVFRRFQRDVSARSYGGLGLGLYIVWVIVEAHGGGVQVESRPNEGTTFTIELPPSVPAVGSLERGVS